MKRSSLLASFVLLGMAPTAQAEFRALIVGIDRYAIPELHDENLGGSADAASIASMLQSRWGAEHPKIKIVCNENATTTRIKNLFQTWLERGAQAGDTLIFYFSGHGTLVEAPDRTVGIRSALAPRDARYIQVGGVKRLDPRRLITGQFFATEMAKLHRAGVKDFTMIVDACQSADIARRRGDYGLKSIPNGFQAPQDSESPLFNAGANLGDFVVMSAARVDSYAWHGPTGGNFTIALRKAVEGFARDHPHHGRPMTYSDLRDRLTQEISRLADNGLPQHPYIQGRLDRPLFSIGSLASDPYFLTTVKGLSEVHVDAGRLLGIHAGAVFDLYPRDTLQFETAKRLARVKVVAADVYESIVTPIWLKGSLQHLQEARALASDYQAGVRRHLTRSGARAVARYRGVRDLQVSNPEVQVDLEPLHVQLDGDRVSAVAKHRSSDSRLAPSSAFTFRVSARGPDPNQYLYIAILDCMPNGSVKALWPADAQSSPDTMIRADGGWNYLGRNGVICGHSEPSQLAAFRLSPVQGSGPEFFKLFVTDETADFTPLLVTTRPGVSQRQPDSGNRVGRPKAAKASVETRYSVATVVLSLKTPRR